MIAYSVTTVPFSVWILKGYYDTVPIELEEAARIDGASQLGAFWRVLLPLSTPALAIVFLFNFLTAWNEYVLARVLIGSKTDLFTWPLGVLRFQAQFQTQWGDLAASLDPDLDPDRGALPLLVEVAHLGRHPRRRQGLAAADVRCHRGDAEPGSGTRSSTRSSRTDSRAAPRAQARAARGVGRPADRPRLQGR